MAEGRKVTAVLEDDPNVRAAMCFLLSDWGFEAAPGVTAAEVCAVLGGDASLISAIVTDFHLGGTVTGVAEAKALIARGAGPRVLVVSGTLHGGAEAQARAAGFDFLQKPVSPDAIEAWLNAPP